MTSDPGTPEQQPPLNEPADRRSHWPVAIVAGVLGLVALVVIIVVATSADDDDDDRAGSATTELVIQSPAVVTGITAAGQVPDPAAASTAPSAPGATTYPLHRELLAAGTFDCTTTGSWQPFTEIAIQFAVGEPAAGTTCGDAVLDLPPGSCASGCTAVPDDWSVVEAAGVTPLALMMVIAPTGPDATTAQLLCVKDFVPQLKQILPVATPIEQACASATIDSVDVPYVPPPTGDIPQVPAGDTIDLPAG